MHAASALRERVADALAATIVNKLDEPAVLIDPNQLALPMIGRESF